MVDRNCDREANAHKKVDCRPAVVARVNQINSRVMKDNQNKTRNGWGSPLLTVSVTAATR